MLSRALIFLALPGCWLDFGGFAVCGTEGATPCPMDGAAVDAEMVDSGPVTGPDAGPDAGPMPADGGPQDAATGPDAGHDAGPLPAPCADGSDGEAWSDSMVGCTGSEVQADAAGLCSSSWHLCSPEEYFLRGGAEADIWSSRTYWLSSCLSPTGCPSAGICTGDEGDTEYSTRDCAGELLSEGTYTLAPMGLVNDYVKRVVGCGGCAYWKPASINLKAGAVCCR